MRGAVGFVVLAWGAAAWGADTDVRVSWREATCDDAVIQAAAKAKAAPACGARKLDWFSVQYKAVGGTGCDVWLAVACTGTEVGTFTGPNHPSLPTLYTDENWGGTALSLVMGKQDLNLIPVREGTDGWNDKAGSVRVPPGYTVRLCSDPGLNGKCADFSADHPKLGNSNVGNDNAASAEVVKGTLPSLITCPRVFENDGYGGMFLDVCNDVTSWAGTSWNDKISSIQLPPGWVVKICADADYGGTCTELLQDAWVLRDTPTGSDRVTSLQIVRRK